MPVSGRRERLLVLGQGPAVLRLVPEIVQAHTPYAEIETHTSSLMAVARLDRGPISAIFTELSTRSGEGLVLLDHVTQSGLEIPVVAAAHRDDHDAASQAIQRGAHEVLLMPLDRTEVVRSLRSALATYRLRQRLRSVEQSLTRLQPFLADVDTQPADPEQAWRRSLSAAMTSVALSKKAKDAIEARLRQREEVIQRYRAQIEAKLESARRRAHARLDQQARG